MIVFDVVVFMFELFLAKPRLFLDSDHPDNDSVWIHDFLLYFLHVLFLFAVLLLDKKVPMR